MPKTVPFAELFFVLKFTVSNFIIVSPITKLSFRIASALFSTLITFYKIYCVLGTATKCLVYVISFVRIALFKSWSFFHQLTQLTRRPFPTAWTRIACYIYLSKTDLTRGSFKFLPFLKLILGISVKTFLCCSSGASKICSSSKKILMFLKTG